MKNNLILFVTPLMLLFGVAAYAQVSVGAGYINSRSTNAIVESDFINEVTSDMVYNGFYAGVGYTFSIMKGLGITPGIYFESITANYASDLTAFTVSSSFSEQFIDIPLHISYGISLSPGVRILAFAGPAASFGIVAKSKTLTEFRVGDDHTPKESSSDSYEGGGLSRFDLFVGGGLGVELLNHFRITVGLNYSLLERHKVKVVDRPQRRHQIVAGIAYVF